MGTVHLQIQGVQCSYGGEAVLDGVTLNVNKGKLVGVLGPNGSGKSTLLKAISRTLRPQLGQILLDEKDIYQERAHEVARQMAVVPQENYLEFPFSVEDLVLMGRTPHLGRFQRESSQDWEKVGLALALTRCSHLAKRRISELSGGERQRVTIARALAQEPEVLLLDEPTSHLDINYQVEILDLIRKLNRDLRLTVVIVLHDVNLASEYCDHLVMLKEGRIFAIGSPQEVITAGNIASVYGSQVLVRPHPIHRRPHITLLSQGNCGQKSRLYDKVHVIGGGGIAAPLMGELVSAGYSVTAGVLNIGDNDWETARTLGIPLAEAPPFSPIGEDAFNCNMELISRVPWVVLASIPFGVGNLPNLRAAVAAADQGKGVMVLEDPPIEKRDYTGGRAGELYKQLLAKTGVFRLEDWSQVLEILQGEESEWKEMED